MSRIPIIGTISKEIIYFVWLVAIIGSFQYIIHRITLRSVVIYTVFGLAYCYYSIFGAANEYLKENLVQFLLINASMIFVGESYDDDLCRNALKKMSMISIVAVILIIYLFGAEIGRDASTVSTSESGHMWLSYSILPHIVLIIYYSFVERKIIDIVFSVIGVILVFSLGTRGPVGSILLLIGILVIQNILHAKYRVLKIGILVITLVLVYLNYYSILSFISSRILGLGMSNRVYNMLSSGDILYNNGRSRITDIIIGGIKQKPWTGYGMAGDRLFGVVYAHNLALELCISYGIPIGVLIITGIVFIVFKKIYKKDQGNSYLVLVLACGNGFFKLLLSSSYLIEYLFFLMIGLSISSWDYKTQESCESNLLNKELT